MVRAGGISASAYSNEQVAPVSPATAYYVAHLFLLPDEPGPSEVTPFLFASTDLCELGPFFKMILNTPPSLHGYSKDFHRYNYLSARLHRFSYFLSACYARNFTPKYSEAFGSYLAKVVYVARRTPISLLDHLTGYEVPAFVVARTDECLGRAKELGIPCAVLRELEPSQLNHHIERSFGTAASPLNPEQRNRLQRGDPEDIEPNTLVATFPERFAFGESELPPYPTSQLRLLLPNESLANQMRRRIMPPPEGRTDHSKNVEQIIESTRTVFAQRLCDYLLIDPEYGLNDSEMNLSLRGALERYVEKRSPIAYEGFVKEAIEHLPEYPGACT